MKRDQKKRCPKCKAEKPITTAYWYRNKARGDGLSSYCKVCHRMITQEWVNQHQEAVRRKSRRYYALHSDDIRKKKQELYRERKMKKYRLKTLITGISLLGSIAIADARTVRINVIRLGVNGIEYMGQDVEVGTYYGNAECPALKGAYLAAYGYAGTHSYPNVQQTIRYRRSVDWSPFSTMWEGKGTGPGVSTATKLVATGFNALWKRWGCK